MSISATVIETIKKGSCHFIGEDTLTKKLEAGKPLRIKAGFDPTGSELHLGHTLLFTKLQTFQELGHEIIFLIGDFTALIGDPSGRNVTRPLLTADLIQNNIQTYQTQLSKVLDLNKTTVCFNTTWLSKLSINQLLHVASTQTVARMLERDDFHKRYQAKQPIGIHEFLYPLLQAYDSVELKADVEIGGTDQLFNLLLGRELQKSYGLEPQVILTLPLLEGLDGIQKMSKSLNNYIGLQEDAFSMFSKLMSISDTLMWRYFECLSLKTSAKKIAVMQQDAAKNLINPRDCKIALALEITGRYHGENQARQSREAFENQFRHKKIPAVVPEIRINISEKEIAIANLLKKAGLTKSTSEALRLIAGNGLKIDEIKISDTKHTISNNTRHLYQLGKKKFVRITVNPL